MTVPRDPQCHPSSRRILVIYRHFWPDSPPYATMLRMLGEKLSEAGHSVTVWSQQPCYKIADGQNSRPARERLNGVLVERLSRIPGWKRFGASRLLDKLLFLPRILIKALGQRAAGREFDLVWTATIPPVAQGLAGRAVSRMFGARFIYHCQDLYPEIAVSMGMWRPDGLVHRLAERIERKNRARADLLVTLSNDMAETVLSLAEPCRLAVINNFPLGDFDAEKGGGSPDRVRLIFAGNLGLFQGLEVIVEAMCLVADRCPTLELILLGEGKALPKLRKLASGLRNVRFEPHRPFEEARRLIASADVGLVSLEPQIYRFAYPSKTLTYLNLGLPVLTIVEPDSTLAATIRREQLGWVTPGRTAEEIATTLEEVCSAPRERASERSRIREWSRANISFEAASARWLDEIGRLAPRR